MLVSCQTNSETKPAPTVFTGKVVGITDGDTVKVLRDNQTVKVRLSGIDTPEMDQPFGKQSKRFVSKLIFGKTVDVKDLGLDRYKRTLGYITEGSTEVNEAIVAAGLAWHSNTLMTRSSLRRRRRLVRLREACGPILSPYHPGSGVVTQPP